MTARAGMTHPGSQRPPVAPAAESMHEFLTALGSGAPAPGGGAAASLCGALAAALVAMVCRVTAERDPSAASEVSPSIARADELWQRLAGLVTDDMDAYRRVIDARRSGGGPDAVQRALTRATEVPLMLARGSRDVLALCESVAPRARASALSDLGVAAALAGGALESGVLTARANLAEVTDARFARASEDELAVLLAEGREARQRALETIASRTKRRD
ncbi:MAG: formiminotransferase-cyclodeaminase [Candidatus Rokuibacteriota bacterium]|nr:MAG: formiminotransferase-cyclodeaminase [Candidatus Rokubacteria bacterium]